MVAHRHIFATYLHIHCFSWAPALMTLNDLGIEKAGFFLFLMRYT